MSNNYVLKKRDWREMETTYGKSQNEISAGLFKEIQEKLGICAAQNKRGTNQTGQGTLDSVGYVNALKFYVKHNENSLNHFDSRI